MSGFPVCVRGPVGSVQGVSEAFPGGRESRFRESLRVLNAFFGSFGRSDQGVSEAVFGRFRDLVGFETLYWRAPFLGGPPRQCRQCRHSRPVSKVVASTFSYRKGTLGCSQNGSPVWGRFRAFSGPRRF